MLWLYLLFAKISRPIWGLVLRRRMKRGKEDPVRYVEKLGQIATQRPAGTVLWVHALSVGEALGVMTVLRRLGEVMPEAHFLLTTVTLTSAQTFKKTGLPPRVIHQFLPADAQGPVNAFLDHWKPDAVAFAELDLWPYMLRQVRKRGLPLMMINGRVTDCSITKYQKQLGDTRRILASFDQFLVQDARSAERLKALGAPADRITTVGSLKAAADPLPDLVEPRLAFEVALAGRPVWLASSTATAEEDQLFAAHALARENIPDLLLVIAPRHIKFADQTQALAQSTFNHVTRRSTGVLPTSDTEVYIADSFGEMGLWCRVCPIVFVGHSMPNCTPALTGKNPFEALVLGQMVVHGPDFANFVAIYEGLLAVGATCRIQDSTDLAARVVQSFKDAPWRAGHVDAAQSIISDGRSAIDLTRGVLQQAVAISRDAS